MNITSIINSIVFSLIGLAIFSMGFYVFDKVTPYNLWKEIVEKQNRALAMIVGAVTLGICLIIASAIHG